MAHPSTTKLQYIEGGVLKTLPAGVLLKNAAETIDVFSLSDTGAHAIGASGAEVSFPGSVDVVENLSVTGTTEFTGDVTVANDLIVSGRAYVSGGRMQIDSTITIYDDNLLHLNAGPSGLSDGGILVDRYFSAWGAADESGNATELTVTANTIDSATVIFAHAGASAVNDAYNNWSLAITGGIGAGQARTITDYVGLTKLATLDRKWDVEPNATSTYALHSAPNRFAGWFFDESADEFVAGVVNYDPGTTQVAIESYLPQHVGALAAEGLATLTGGASLPDSANLVLGTGSDLTVVHNGTNTVATSTTGDLIIDNTNAAGATVIRLGSNDQNSVFSVQKDNQSHLLDVKADGSLIVIGGGSVKTSGGDLSVGGGMGGGQLVLLANNSAQVALSNGAFVPETDSALALGSSAKAFSSLYIDTITSLDANFAFTLGSTTVAPKIASMSTAQRDALTPANGMVIYNSTNGRFEGYEAGAWSALVNAPQDLTGITGTTNLSYTINSDVANGDGNASLILQSGNGTDATSAGTLYYVYGAGANGGIWSYGAHVRVADDKQLKLGTDSDVTLAFVSGSSLFDVNVAGAVELDASGAVSVESSGGALNFGADDVDQNVNVGTDGERSVVVGSVNGAASLALRAGSGNFVVTAGGILDLNVTGAATLDAASFSIDSTGASNVSVTGANLTLSTLTSGTLGLSSAGAATFDAASSVTIGGTNATSLDLGRSGQMTTIKGTLNVDEAVTLDSKLSASDDVVIALGKSVASSGWTTGGCAAGEVVYASAASTVSLADADNSSASKIIGVVNAAGEVVHMGPCSFHLDAGGCAVGDRLYASPTAGRVTATAPSTATQYVAPVGISLAVVAANGTGRGIFMREPATLLG